MLASAKYKLAVRIEIMFLRGLLIVLVILAALVVPQLRDVSPAQVATEITGESVEKLYTPVNQTVVEALVVIPADAPLVEFSIESGHIMENGKSVPRFLTNNLTVKKGDHVRINITNIKGRHDFKIDEFNAFSETPEGETVTVDFYADKAGEFIYYCTKPGHRTRGHWGTLIVKE